MPAPSSAVADPICVRSRKNTCVADPLPGTVTRRTPERFAAVTGSMVETMLNVLPLVEARIHARVTVAPSE